jgi:uncharacterized protein (TIGR03790 family)
LSDFYNISNQPMHPLINQEQPMASRRALIILALFLFPSLSQALGPKDVFLIVNKNVPESKEVAEHYCQKRGVPTANIIVLDLPTGESVSRQDFNDKLRDPLRELLEKRKDEVKVLLSIYGVPLRVGASAPNEDEKKRLAELQQKIKDEQAVLTKLQAEVKELQDKIKEAKTDELEKQLEEAQAKVKPSEFRIQVWQQTQRTLNHGDTVASVDSELMLLWWGDYNLHRWQANLLNWQIPDAARNEKPPILMVSRLDGPSPAIAKRLVDDAIATEKTGLKGNVHVDARGIAYKPADGGTGYGGYDESLREMAKLLKEDAKMPVTLDNKGALFAPQSCTDTALYCGWYSHARYVDCCQFSKGAVAYHIASSEAVSLRNDKATYWCPNLLKDGVAATIGPVAEPYTVGFPKPAEFFGLLVTGEFTLVECYSKTLLLNSWMTVLVGDPLYNPYKNSPMLRPDQIRPSPAGSGMIFKSGGKKPKD